MGLEILEFASVFIVKIILVIIIIVCIEMDNNDMDFKPRVILGVICLILLYIIVAIKFYYYGLELCQ